MKKIGKRTNLQLAKNLKKAGTYGTVGNEDKMRLPRILSLVPTSGRLFVRHLPKTYQFSKGSA